MNEKVEAIERLAMLLDDGKIDEAEFKRLKEDIVSAGDESFVASQRRSGDGHELLAQPTASPILVSRVPVAAWIMGGLGFVAGAVQGGALSGLIGGLIWIGIVTGLAALYRWLKRGLTPREIGENVLFSVIVGLAGSAIYYVSVFLSGFEEAPSDNYPDWWGVGLLVAIAAFVYYTYTRGSWPGKQPSKRDAY